MAEKNLIMYHDKDPKYITFLAGNTYEETIYAITKYLDDEGNIQEESVELAVHVDDMIKMRDFLNTIISKIGPAGEYTEDNILIKTEAD